MATSDLQWHRKGLKVLLLVKGSLWSTETVLFRNGPALQWPVISCLVQPKTEESAKSELPKKKWKRSSCNSQNWTVFSLPINEGRRGKSLSSRCAEWQVSGELHNGMAQWKLSSDLSPEAMIRKIFGTGRNSCCFLRLFCCSKDTKLDEYPQGILLPLEVTGDTQHLLPGLCRIKCCLKHPGCCNCVACSWSPVSGWRACRQDCHLCGKPCCLLALQSRSTDRQSWACAYALCELRARCFVLKGINKWFFEANGLFCLHIYAIISLQSCNSLLDVRLALYTLTLMSCHILTRLPSPHPLPSHLPSVALNHFSFPCLLLTCSDGCLPFCLLGVWQ